MRNAIIALVLLLSGPGAPGWSLDQTAPFELSCASFPADITESMLRERYGEDNVVAGSVTGREDDARDGTLLFPRDSASVLEIEWHDSSRQRPRWIQAKGESGRWTTPAGIHLGMDLRSLERMNGRPFRLAGFVNEIAGMIQSWAGGRLERPRATGCELTIYMYPRPETTGPDGRFREVGLGTNYSSGHPAMQQLNPRVVAIGLHYGGD